MHILRRSSDYYSDNVCLKGSDHGQAPEVLERIRHSTTRQGIVRLISLLFFRSEIMAQSLLINKILHTDYLEIVHNGLMKDLSVLQENPLRDRGNIDEVLIDYDNHA